MNMTVYLDVKYLPDFNTSDVIDRPKDLLIDTYRNADNTVVPVFT